MANFNIALFKVLQHEGNYINDPADLGGETYKGVARNAHPNWQGWSIIDQHKAKPHFIHALEQDTYLQNLVEQFYFESFWKPLKAEEIQNQTNANALFDFAINAGITTAVKVVQKIVGTVSDGVLGPITLKKINTMDFGHFQAALTVARIDFYMYIIRRRPTSKRFLLGWISRSLSFND